jgi:hypothetical protein
MTQHYEVFGGTLSSDMEIEELPVSATLPADWTLRVLDGPAPMPEGELLGTDIVFGETRVRGYRNGDGFVLAFDDTGRFDVSSTGSEITWYRPPSAELQSAQADLTSRVLALALHASGIFTLHASAVSVAGTGLAFLAPKHHGKSTLCSALVLAGGRALSDDTVPVRPGSTPLLSPGLPRLRLWTDAAARLFGTDEGTKVRKRVMDDLEADQVETRSVRFGAAYVLNPVTALPDGAVVARDRLDTVAATMSLVRHSKLGPVLAGSESPVLLARAADIAGVVPVYVLHVVRDLDRIDQVAKQLFAWHAGAANS